MRSKLDWLFRVLSGAIVVGGLGAAGACAKSVENGFPPGSNGGGSNSGFANTGNGALGSGQTTTAADPSACVKDRVCSNGCGDFGDGTPILDAPDGGPAAPSNASSQFGGSGTASGGPCIVEPGDGVLLPNNWARPRFRWTASGGQSLFRITLHADREAHDLVVYTAKTEWTMPADMWKALAATAWDDGSGNDTISVTVAAAGSPPAASTIKFSIAPALAKGSMIYWAAVGDKPGDSWLEGFHVGDEGVAQVLTTNQVQSKLSRDVGGNLRTTNAVGGATLPNGPGSVQCIGCHAAVPDKQSVTFLDFYPWPGIAANVSVDDAGAGAGQVPGWLTAGGGQALAQPWLGMMAFSPAVWNGGDHVVVAGYQTPAGDTIWQDGTGPSGPTAKSRLAWIDLSTSTPPADVPGSGSYNSAGVIAPGLMADEGKSYGFIARNGDSRGVACPTWSHDGNTIVYASTDVAKDGRVGGETGNPVHGTADLYSVPYADKAGGKAAPVPGASTPDYAEYYPSFSADDRFVAFTRTPESEGIRYYAPKAEVWLVKADGTSGQATRLAANDPPACMGVSSPGVTNSWPKWAPENPSCGGKTYYWLIFSSSRLGMQFNTANMQMPHAEVTSQLYLTAVVDDGKGGAPKTYPGVYIWNQPTTSAAYQGSSQSNHTPLWDVTEIPPSVVGIPK